VRFNVGVLVPSTDLWHARFGMSLVSLVSAYLSTPIPGATEQELFVLNKRGSILPKSRQGLVEEALGRGATHLFWIDSDQVVPAETIHRLLSVDKDIVAANVATKATPSRTTARNKNHVTGAWDQVFTVNGEHPDRLEKVERVGMGVMMVKAEVFQRMKKPWFGVTWNDKRQDFEGEDWFFIRLARDHGYTIWVDHLVSLYTEHIGSYGYSHGDVELVGKGEEDGDKQLALEFA